MAKPKDCPCHSGRRYAACCGPFHEAKSLPATPSELMRSRYAAFALGLGKYLVDTLATEHEDRVGVPPEALARELSRAKDRQRFLGLRIVHEAVAGDRGEVLFVARVYERGTDGSFAELSRFVREDGRWTYLEGDLLPTERLPADHATLNLEQFQALLER